MSLRKTSVVLALLFVSAPAMAAGWGDFVSAFPTQPCQDGWVACLLDGDAVSPELKATDSSNLPMPTDLRVSWFELKPTPSFSPFGTLSSYTGELPVAEPEPPPPVADAGAEDDYQPEPVDDGGSDAVADLGGGDDGGSMVRPSDDGGGSAVRPSDGGGSMVRPSDDDGGGSAVRPSDGGGSMVRPSADDGGSAISVRPAAGGTVRPADGGDAVADAGSPPPPTPDSSISVRPTAPAAPADDSCDSLVKLEPAAMMGKLSDGQIACIEASFAAAAKQTEKDKLSRILMTNAYSKGDQSTWAKLMKRHLEQVDQSDPDLCYKYALYLNKKGPSRAYGVIKWCNTALENRTVWTGDTYVSRVYSLYKLRAAAAQKLWKAAEEKHASAPDDSTSKAVDDARNQTKVFSREWYEYAKASGKDSSKALQLCVSAAGTADYCEGS